MKRIGTHLCLLFSIIFLPWWVTLCIAIVGMFVFSHFYEAIIAGFILYIVYAGGSTQFFASKFWLPVLLVGIYLSITIIKRFIILYK